MYELIKAILQKIPGPDSFSLQAGLSLVVCLSLAACSSNKPIGQGLVLSEQLLSPTDRTVETKTGALSGAAVGSVLGALGGAAAGAACTLATFGLCAPMVPGYVLGGAAVGGGVGTASGAAIGYGVGSYQQGTGLHQYVVMPCTDRSEPIRLQQQSATPMPPGTRVLIYSSGQVEPRIYRIQKVRKKDEKHYPKADCSAAAEQEAPFDATDLPSSEESF